MSRGITHIEELPVRDFIRVIENLREYEATEKLDGSQILFGLDEIGFYTSRETKGGERVYNVDNYELTFPNTFKRSTHCLLESVLTEMKAAGLKIGDQVEAEVLFGEVPNVVPYSKDTNYLIFLRTTEGTVDINELKAALDNTSTTVSLTVPVTKNGIHITFETTKTKWKISRSPILKIRTGMKAFTKWNLQEIKNQLAQDSGILDASNETILNTPLNKVPDWMQPADWKVFKSQIKEKRKEIEEQFAYQQAYIKNGMLVSNLVYHTASKFGPKKEDGGWIEGIVLRHRITGEMVKIVDKDTFNTRRIEAWAERNKLTERPRGLAINYSFLGELLCGIGLVFSVPELGTTQAKKFYNPDNYQKPVSKYLRERIIIVLNRKTNDLQHRLDKYEKKTAKEQRKSAEIHDGAERGVVSDSIKTRTLETFATLFEHLALLEQSVQVATNEAELIKAIFGKYLE